MPATLSAPRAHFADNGRSSPEMPSLPDVTVVDLPPHTDARGSLVTFEPVETHADAPGPRQWNHVVSQAGVLRGIHVHHIRWDYLYLVDGKMSLALIDVRRDSADFNKVSVTELRGNRPQRVCIPPGVAHGFLFTADAVLMQGMSHLWDPGDELGCHWNSADLDIPWQPGEPLLSPRDAAAGTFSAMVEAFHQAKSIGP